MKVSSCAELQDCSPFPPAHPPAANLPAPGARGQLGSPQPCKACSHTLCICHCQQMQPSPWSKSHVLAAATTKAQQGRRAALQPLRSREVGQQTCSSLGWEWGPLASPKCLNLHGRKKQRKTNDVTQCLQKRNHYFPTGFRGSCWGEGEEQKK